MSQTNLLKYVNEQINLNAIRNKDSPLDESPNNPAVRPIVQKGREEDNVECKLTST